MAHEERSRVTLRYCKQISSPRASYLSIRSFIHPVMGLIRRDANYFFKNINRNKLSPSNSVKISVWGSRNIPDRHTSPLTMRITSRVRQIYATVQCTSACVKHNTLRRKNVVHITYYSGSRLRVKFAFPFDSIQKFRRRYFLSCF